MEASMHLLTWETPMAVDEQYAQALRELARLERYLATLEDAALKLLEWDRDRNFILPYRVRDPIIKSLNSKDAEAVSEPAYKEAARKLWMLLDDIDTLDDACRADDAAFRKHARDTQRKRFAILSGEQMDVLLSSSS